MKKNELKVYIILLNYNSYDDVYTLIPQEIHHASVAWRHYLLDEFRRDQGRGLITHIFEDLSDIEGDASSKDFLQYLKTEIGLPFHHVLNKCWVVVDRNTQVFQSHVIARTAIQR